MWSKRGDEVIKLGMDNILTYEAFIHTVRMLPDSHTLFLIDFFCDFWNGSPVIFFPRACSFYFLSKISRPINFLVVSDDRVAAYFEYWMNYICIPNTNKSTILGLIICSFMMKLIGSIRERRFQSLTQDMVMLNGHELLFCWGRRVENVHQNLHSELVASNRILVFAQRFLESPRGKQCNSLEGNIWRKVVLTSKKTILERDQRFFAAILIMMLMRGQRKFLLELPRNML